MLLKLVRMTLQWVFGDFNIHFIAHDTQWREGKIVANEREYHYQERYGYCYKGYQKLSFLCKKKTAKELCVEDTATGAYTYHLAEEGECLDEHELVVFLSDVTAFLESQVEQTFVA